jgi:hypothetical protein
MCCLSQTRGATRLEGAWEFDDPTLHHWTRRRTRKLTLTDLVEQLPANRWVSSIVVRGGRPVQINATMATV